jgi:hypothetical protein
MAMFELEEQLKRDETLPLSDVRGQWKLFSSMCFDMTQDQIGATDMNEDFYEVSELSILNSLRNTCTPRGDVAARLEMNEDDAGAWSFSFKTPQSANLDGIKVKAYQHGDPSERRKLGLLFLGRGI